MAFRALERGTGECLLFLGRQLAALGQHELEPDGLQLRERVEEAGIASCDLLQELLQCFVLLEFEQGDRQEGLRHVPLVGLQVAGREQRLDPFPSLESILVTLAAEHRSDRES